VEIAEFEDFFPGAGTGEFNREAAKDAKSGAKVSKH
jgi:hypothetical protein